MCPGKDATEKEIEEVCRERSFHAPYWKGLTARTDIPGRVLSLAEVYVINRKYLELAEAKKHAGPIGRSPAARWVHRAHALSDPAKRLGHMPGTR